MDSPQALATDVKYIRKALDELKESTLKGFTVMTTKQEATNGRVRTLEIWKAVIVGFCTCMTVVVLPVMYMLLKAAIERL
ncbi:hypothetical protein Pan258_01740 [Symmachiella dynata]|uniref:hypothetical protein n=1 Tax=Symmachiella dynata TaxID=2527995 RepID=UPI001189CB18|nr:hypothetical protein [Symmachiella dynata]QDT46157.1 hypothetical protein Pan258_01740 [Symmachiella dynata]